MPMENHKCFGFPLQVIRDGEKVQYQTNVRNSSESKFWQECQMTRFLSAFPPDNFKHIDGLNASPFPEFIRIDFESDSAIIVTKKYEMNLLQAVQKGKIDTAGILKILLKISDGLQFIHKHKMVHNDVKAENIVVSFNDNNNVTDAKLIDWEQSSILGNEEDNVILYGSYHDPPEGQLSGTASDVWSFARTLSDQLGAFFDEAQKKWLQDHCLKKNRSDRVNMTAVFEFLKEILDQQQG